MKGSKQFKVLHLIHSLEMGGAQKVISSLVKHHDRSRFVPIVGSLRRGGVLEELIHGSGVEVVYFDKSSRLDIGCAIRLRRYVRENEITIVNAHNFSASFWGRIACAGLKDVIFIITEHGRLANPRLAVIFFNRLFAGGVDAIIAVSDETASFTKARYPYNAHKIRVVNNGIDIPALPGWTREKLSDEFGVPQGSPVVANLAALTPVKDQATLIKAISYMRPDNHDVRLLLIGNGPLRGKLEDLVRELGLAENVIFAGERVDGPEILAACDAFCLSSRAEGIPISLLEAIAYNCPVVATAVGGIPEVINDGEDGLLVPPGDIKVLASNLERILNDRGLAERVAGNARLRLLSDFSAEEMTARTEGIYGEVLERIRAVSKGKNV